MLEIKNVWKTYIMGQQELSVLKNVSLKIEDGDYVAIMGPSGSGKSSLMNVLGLLDVPSKGSYQVDGKETSHLSEDDLAILRREVIGFIFQQFHLLSKTSALHNVALPLLYSEKKMKTTYARELLKRVGLEARADHHPSELSGGQQQRVAIARSLVNKPRIILADEPTGNLDSISEKEIMAILDDLNAQGITVVIVTHEEEIGRKAKRLIRMRDGEVQSDERLRPIQNDVRLEKKQITSAAGFMALSEAWEYFSQGLQTLAANKVRTFLSVLGILIGVAAVITMIAVGNGAQESIKKDFSALGSNLLTLRPGSMRVGGVAQASGSTTRLTIDDTSFIKKNIKSVKNISANVNSRAQVTFQNKNWNTLVIGSTSEYEFIHSSTPTVGRFFIEEENKRRETVAIVGATVVRELFGQKNPVGEQIKINKVNFRIIGILPEKGATGFRDQDDVIIVPLQTGMRRLMGKEYVDNIEIEIKSAEEMDAAEENITKLLRAKYRIPSSQEESGFEIRNMADIQNAISSSSKTMSLLLAAIAGISLLVGGIGIMNIMLVSVTERTKEIGLRKAIGARRNDILFQFLSESVVVSAVGGSAGILVGWILTKSLTLLVGWTTTISLSSVLLSFVFSAGVGMVFGIYPARKASMLHPIDALRSE